MKVLFWIVRNRKNKNGLCPISCRITINGKRAEIWTGIYVKPGQLKNGTLKGKSKVFEAYNYQLSKLKNELILLYYEFQRTKKLSGPKEIKAAYLRTCDIKNVRELLIDYLVAAKEFLSSSTLIALRRKINAFNNCLVKMELDNITPGELSYEVVAKIRKFLISELNYSQSYTRAIIVSLTSGLEWALSHGKIEKNPLHGYRSRFSTPRSLSYLTVEEQERIRNFELPQKYSQLRDFFLIQCNTGLSYVDVLRVKPEHISRDEEGCLWIIINRQKVQSAKCQILINDYILSLFEKHKFTFDIGVYNTVRNNLRIMGEIIGIEKKLTTHLGRKTFATTLLNKDVPMETVSKMLGHKSVRTTENYYAEILQMKIARDVRGIVEKNEMLQPA